MKQCKTTTKRIFSLVMSIAMLFSIMVLPNKALARDDATEGYSEQRADISYEYLGITDSDVETYRDSFEEGLPELPSGTLSDFEWTAGSYVWIGVYVEHMTRINDMFQIDDGGLSNLTVSMLYNTDYLEWNIQDAATSFGAFLNGDFADVGTDTPLDPKVPYPYATGRRNNTTYYESTGSNSTYQSFKDISEDQYFYDVEMTDVDSHPEKINEARQAIKIDRSAPKRMFSDDYMKDDKTLVALFPFKMKETTAPSAGTKILQGSLGPSSFVINVGLSGDNSYNFLNPRSQSSDTNLYCQFNIVNNVINLFPAKYTVTYHAGDDATFSAGNESKNTESVLEGEHPTLKNSDGNEISSLLTPPEGKVFEGWYEGEVCTHSDETKFDTSSTVSADKDVHAHYTDGYKVTFNLNGENAQFADGNSDAKSFTASKGESVIQTSLQDLIGTDPTRNDYTFDGWYTKKEDTFIKKYEEQDIRDNTENSLDLYAKWTPTNAESKQYTLHFDANLPAEGVKTQADPQSVKYDNGDKLQDLIGGLPVPPKPQGTYEGYDFLGWYNNKSGDGEMLTEDKIINDYVTVDETNNATVYASWGYVLGPYEEPQEDAITVHFDNTDGKYSGTEGGTYKHGTINDKTVKYGGKIANMPDPADMTLEGKGFDGWYTKQNGAGTKVTADTLINGDLDVEPKLTETTGQTLNLYANWSDQITISFDDNGATGDNPESIQIYSGQSLQDAGKTLPDNPTRENYEFLGWFYEADGDIKQAQNDTVFTEDTQLHAKWRGKINVSFKTKSFVYNDTEQTPLTDDNLEITLLDDGGQKVEPTVTISDLKADSFTAQYKKHEGETIYNSNVPKDANKYDIKLTIKEETIQSLNKEKYMEYTPVTFDNEYDITAKSITLKVSNNYQYLEDISAKENIVLEFNDGTVDPKPNITDIFTSDDIKVTFTDAKNADTEDVMPNAFGKYDIKVESTNTNYEIETLVDSQGGDADLHLIPLKRTVTFNFGEGKAAIEGAAQAGNTMDYTVMFDNPMGTNPTAGETIKATIEDNGDKKTLPVSGTDFIPPESYKLVKFVTLGEGEESPSDTSPEFNVDTDISPSADPLVVYAVYELDEVDVTFNDTKTTDTETAIKYTVQAGQAIQDEGAVKKIDGEVQTATDVPTPKKAPANKKFAGWSTEKSFADGSITGNYHESDWTSHDKKFEKSTEITGAIDVYAVYILSDDASLKKPGDDGTGSGAVFKKDSAGGNDLPYANENWQKQPDQKFDPDTEKHYLIVDDDETETVYGEITPSQPGSNVEVKVNGQPVEGGVTGPDENGKVTFTFKPEQTTYDKDHDTNSSTKVEVTVTAPDGTEEKTYEFDILQYAKPEIVLEYGNSPVGLINRMAEDVSSPWDKDKIKQATDAFNDSHEINKKFGVGLVPTNGQADLTYVAEAWRSYKDDGGQVINYDLNPYALFAYEGSTFTVPGYTVYNELDREVSGAEANVNFVVKQSTVTGVCSYDDDTTNLTDLNMSTKLQPGTKNTYNLSNTMIRMDVYPVKYTYQLTLQDGGTEDLSVERPVIIIGRRGDIFLNEVPTVNDGDVDYLKLFTQNINSGNSLVAYRCMDLFLNDIPTINDGDVDYLRLNTQAVNSSKQFYSNIN